MTIHFVCLINDHVAFFSLHVFSQIISCKLFGCGLLKFIFCRECLFVLKTTKAVTNGKERTTSFVFIWAFVVAEHLYLLLLWKNKQKQHRSEEKSFLRRVGEMFVSHVTSIMAFFFFFRDLSKETLQEISSTCHKLWVFRRKLKAFSKKKCWCWV